MNITTRAIHTPPSKTDPHHALSMPIYEGAAFEFETAEDLEQAFNGQKPAHVYSRSSNPTVEYFETRVKAITGAHAVLAAASGMAAISNLFLAICQSGDNIIASPQLFGNTYSLLDHTLRQWGLEVRWAAVSKPETLLPLMDARTRAVFFETITNPQLTVADISAIAALAKPRRILTIADTTVTPLFFGDMQKLGLDIEVLSSTKFISGGATSVGGLIVDYGTFDWSHNPKLAPKAADHGKNTLIFKLRREVFRNLGACLSPTNACLQALGLETVTLRAAKACANARIVADFLARHPKVARVNFPGAPEFPDQALMTRQFGDYTGAILTFDLSSKAACYSFMNKLNIIRRATNLNDNKSLIIHPDSTIFTEFPEAKRRELGLRDTMIRLSVGIEDPDDLLDDLQQALNSRNTPQ